MGHGAWSMELKNKKPAYCLPLTVCVESMKKIVELSKQSSVNYDQLIHWNSKGSDQ
jgi:hypothetical protein